MKGIELPVNVLVIVAVAVLVLLGVITLFVVIGLITNWSFLVDKNIKNLFEKESDETESLSEINLTYYNCPRQVDEIAKNGILCYEKAQKIKLTESGSCYLLLVNGSCNLSQGKLIPVFENDGFSQDKVNYLYTKGDSKIYINFDYYKNSIEVK